MCVLLLHSGVQQSLQKRAAFVDTILVGCTVLTIRPEILVMLTTFSFFLQQLRVCALNFWKVWM